MTREKHWSPEATLLRAGHAFQRATDADFARFPALRWVNPVSAWPWRAA